MSNYVVNKDVVNGLNHLLTRSKDAGEGFVEVANNINYPDLTQWLINWAKTHEEHAQQLVHVLEVLDEDADAETSFMGELHQMWIDLKAQWTNNDTAALLDECIRGEESAIKDYKDVMEMNMVPNFTRDILRHQQRQIEDAVKNLKVLKKAYHEKEMQS